MRKSLSVLSDRVDVGKSTLFRLITGLEKVSTGQIELTETKNHPVGYMPQKDMLLPWRTIIENAALPLECQGVQKKEAEVKAKELLHKFGLQGYEKKISERFIWWYETTCIFLFELY